MPHLPRSLKPVPLCLAISTLSCLVRSALVLPATVEDWRECFLLSLGFSIFSHIAHICFQDTEFISYNRVCLPGKKNCDKAVLLRDKLVWFPFFFPLPSPGRLCNWGMELFFSFSALWDQLLEGRIKLQKALLTTNQLPQPDVFPVFKDKGGPEFASALKNSKHTYWDTLQHHIIEKEKMWF